MATVVCTPSILLLVRDSTADNKLCWHFCPRTLKMLLGQDSAHHASSKTPEKAPKS